MVHDSVGEMGDNSGWVSRIMDVDPWPVTIYAHIESRFIIYFVARKDISVDSVLVVITALCNSMFPETGTWSINIT